MKCPACQREMQKGYFRNADQPVQWIPEGRKPSIWKCGVANGAVVLEENASWRGYCADAYYCSQCKMVLVPVK